MKEPTSAGECLYFTNRTIGTGKAIAWALRPECPKCKKGRLGKPIKKTGKVDKKAEYFECSLCKHQLPLEEAEKSVVLEVKYTCPHCSSSGETSTEYKRRNFEGILSYVFSCLKCGKNIGITKKLKEKKGKDLDDG